MKTFTGYEYLMIDVANCFGLDKLLFEPRIQWVRENMDNLENLLGEAKAPMPFIKAVMALRDAQEFKPTGHIMGLDACASGVQILAVMSGCEVTARNTGLIDPDVRADLYTITTDTMGTILGNSVELDRELVKYAQMTGFYGSKRKPIELFGEDTPELEAFYQANRMVAPGACDLMVDMQASWQPFELEHSWVLPDGFHAHVKVMEEFEVKVEVDELDHATFTHYFSENCGQAKGISLAANITHSVDGMVVREMGRRCNYNPFQLKRKAEIITKELTKRSRIYSRNTDRFLSLNLLDMPNRELLDLDTNTLNRLLQLIGRTMQNPSFEMLAVHDEFRCSPNHCNTLRQTYIDIFAELAESTIAQDILNQINKCSGSYKKNSNRLGELIRGSNYAIC